MTFEFIARSVAAYVEDDVCVVSFADSVAVDPERYLVLSQALFETGDDDEQISVEYGKDGRSFNADSKSAHIDANAFELSIAAPAKGGLARFKIEIACKLPNDFVEHLRRIFSKSKAKLIVA